MLDVKADPEDQTAYSQMHLVFELIASMVAEAVDEISDAKSVSKALPWSQEFITI